jgi:peptidoglycan/LPS O-acetylase OafA/YrhL
MAAFKIDIGSPPAGRLPVLDELKGLAIVGVILYHAGGVLGLSNRFTFDLGVDIFVILSGLGLALSSREESPGSFLKRRLLRIMPAYWVVLTLYLPLNAHFLQRHYGWDTIVLHYLGVHGWFGDKYAMDINDSFWFITLILTLYVFYGLGRPLLKTTEWFLFGGAILALGGTMALFYTGQSGAFAHIGLRLPSFFFGVLLGLIVKRGSLTLKLNAPLVAAALLITYVSYIQGIVFYSWLVALVVMAAYVYLWKPRAPSGAEKSTAKVLTFLGEHSLEIFLIHQPLIREYNVYLEGRWFNIIAPTQTSLAVGIAIGLAVTLVASVELHALLKKLPGLKAG